MAVNQFILNSYFITVLNIVNKPSKFSCFIKKIVSERKLLRLKETIDFVLNSDNSDCDTSVVIYPVMKKMMLIAS